MSDKTTTLLFLLSGEEILLAMKKRGFGSDRWNGIGGKLKPGETVEQALVRECQEEIRVTPTVYTKVAEHDFLLDSDGAEPWHMHVHAYLATTWEGEPVETEEMAPQWFTVADIPYDYMWQDDRYWLPQVLDGKLVRTEFTFNTAEKLLSSNVTEVERL